MTPVPIEYGVGGIAILPDHRSLSGCPVFELNGPSAATPDKWFRDNIPSPAERSES
jgi:hypothetical protein